MAVEKIALPTLYANSMNALSTIFLTPFLSLDLKRSARATLVQHRSLIEGGIWVMGLLAMGLADPASEGLFDLCLFKAIGLPGCPGCGLGHAIGYIFRGEWALAIHSHPLSPFVLLILLHRIASLVRSTFQRN
ncbi:MAG: DUF2752 domain-containing protein [Bacteroidetes bacterium]|nr:DUF2752 domain-containing protein [Bacteroidota bacterium]